MRVKSPMAMGLFTAAVATTWFGFAGAAAWQRGRGADAVRQWTVCQYVRAWKNPFEISEAILKAKFGPNNESNAKIYDIPREAPSHLAGEVLLAVGPPESTYPPSAVGILTVTLGWLPSSTAVLVAWIGVNGLAVVAIAVLLRRAPNSTSPRTPNLGLTESLWLILLYSPFFVAIAASQFSIVVFVCLLLGCRRAVGTVPAGLALAGALIKPSVSLPFLIIPVLQGRLRALLVAATVHVVAMVGMSWAVETSPLTLTSQWLSVSRYFLQGMYSIQEIINALHWQRVGPFVSLAFLTANGAMCVAARHATADTRFAFLGMTSVLWTYHGPYDFVCALPALLVLFEWRWLEGPGRPDSERATGRLSKLLAIGGFVLLSLAFGLPVLGADAPLARAFRWAARLMLLGLYAAVAYRLVKEHRTIGGPKSP